MCSTLTEEEIVVLLRRALTDIERGLGAMHLEASDDALRKIAAYSSGDARSANNVLEWRQRLRSRPDLRLYPATRFKRPSRSAFCSMTKAAKSTTNHLRAAQIGAQQRSDAALYWLARMLEAGEDPLYIARRVVRMAVEDIAWPNQRARVCMAARDAVDFIGMPEGNLALAQAVVYLSIAPKSNALTPPTARCNKTSSKPPPNQSRCTCATRPPT